MDALTLSIEWHKIKFDYKAQARINLAELLQKVWDAARLAEIEAIQSAWSENRPYVQPPFQIDSLD